MVVVLKIKAASLRTLYSNVSRLGLDHCPGIAYPPMTNQASRTTAETMMATGNRYPIFMNSYFLLVVMATALLERLAILL